MKAQRMTQFHAKMQPQEEEVVRWPCYMQQLDGLWFLCWRSKAAGVQHSHEYSAGKEQDGPSQLGEEFIAVDVKLSFSLLDLEKCQVLFDSSQFYVNVYGQV